MSRGNVKTWTLSTGLARGLQSGTYKVVWIGMKAERVALISMPPVKGEAVPEYPGSSHNAACAASSSSMAPSRWHWVKRGFGNYRQMLT